MSDQSQIAALKSAAKAKWRFLWLHGVTALLCSLLAASDAFADMLPNFPPGLRIAQNRSSFGTVLTTDPGQQCRAAVAAAGRQYGIPDHVMLAIAQVESGRRLPDGRVVPWPWSINAAGEDHVFESRDAAVASVRQFQADGTKSIDVGCMQVNLLHHPTAFATIEQGFDPVSNATYAAKFLRDLFAQTGSWAKAIADYHSARPELGEAYRRKVMQAMAQETRSGPAWANAAEPNAVSAVGEMATGDVPMGDAASLAPLPSGNGAIGHRTEAARTLSQPSAGVGRGLAEYRARPVRIAGKPS